MPFRQGQFDLIGMFDVLEHLENDEEILSLGEADAEKRREADADRAGGKPAMEHDRPDRPPSAAV